MEALGRKAIKRDGYYYESEADRLECDKMCYDINISASLYGYSLPCFIKQQVRDILRGVLHEKEKHDKDNCDCK